MAMQTKRAWVNVNIDSNNYREVISLVQITVVISGDGRTTCKQTRKRTTRPPLNHMAMPRSSVASAAYAENNHRRKYHARRACGLGDGDRADI